MRSTFIRRFFEASKLKPKLVDDDMVFNKKISHKEEETKEKFWPYFNYVF